MSKQSRLDEISKKRSEKNIILILLGIIILSVVFFLYGIPLLINFSLFIMNLKGGNDSGANADNTIYIAPPILDPLPDATNSAKITISGTSTDKQTIKLYINNKYLKDTNINDEQKFVFSNISLTAGDNDIKTKSVNPDNKESGFSPDVHIIYKNKPPELQINSPQDQQSFSGNKQIKVEGITDPAARVTINEFWAIVDNKGNFSYLLNLQKGENKIKIVALDDAGNNTTKELTISLNQ